MTDRTSPLIANKTQVSGLRGSSPAWFCSTLLQNNPVCCILPEEHMVPHFEQDMLLFSSAPIIAYPGYEIPPYTPLSPDQQTTAARLSALYQILENREPFVLVISIEALLRLVMPRNRLQQHAELVLAGEECDLFELRTSMSSMGYEHVSLVKSVGDFSIRGGIIDIYPPAFLLPDGQLHEGPIRLDFFGDTIESLRSFDPISQRSKDELEEAVLLPVSEIFISPEKTRPIRETVRALNNRCEEDGWSAEKSAEISMRLQTGQRFAGIEFFLPLFYGSADDRCAAVLDYLPPDTRLIFLDYEAINQQMQLIWERIQANFHSARNEKTPALFPDEIFLTPEQLAGSFNPFSCYQLTDFLSEGSGALRHQSNSHHLLKQEISLRRKKEGLLAPLAAQIENWFEKDERVIICCRSQHRQKTLSELLARFPFTIVPLSTPVDLDMLAEKTTERELYLCDHPLSMGFSLPEKKLHLLSENELFGEMRLGGKKRKKGPPRDPVKFAELVDGTIVVHREHGIGLYRGMMTIELQGIINDFILLEYREGDKLYLPIDRLTLISRYEGLSDKQPKLDKLGSQSWKATKKKVSDEVWKVAQELLDIYAQRELRNGRIFSPAGELYRELEESFPYDETSGQYRAITEVIDDLLSDRPMDRLICGDVGYGKTEVAIRAAFKVVEDGFQVAILVPTTVLAEQHAKTFRERLQDFPVRVGCINRFRTPAEQRHIVRDLSAGAIDIIIGTHRLLSKDIIFKNLGLLVVDEEHRFGVSHKEKIKRLKAEVDILTLTATPIPRTLQMSLLGIRDLSVISTPPEHRRPVKTFVARYDDLVIKEAVNREILRGGQVFVVHNRVRSIHRMAATIQNLVPHARVAVAHGQMAGKELEEIMVAFVNHHVDVLISTTIIESGLDIPTANTIIINRADRLGLAEIYQLRGRVGRSATQSFAYLLVPSLDHLSKDSRERLRALMEYNELGGGFKLAMSDLQIRGGGNLLGVSQSGHISAIGYDLYLDLLQKTVADLKSKTDDHAYSTYKDDIDPEINVKISAYIPESYIADTGQRYIIYRRIAGLSHSDESAYADLLEELTDRYGPQPQEVDNLFKIVAIKKRLIPLRVNKLERGQDSLVFSFMPDTPVRPERLLTYLQSQKSGSRLTPDGRLVCNTKVDAIPDMCNVIQSITTDLLRFTTDDTSVQ
jgi:transcription-repair coupling factor (superfamily II helicase)